MPVNRIIVTVLDSVGIGEAPDAAAFADFVATIAYILDVKPTSYGTSFKSIIFPPLK